jgi:hypothetical protein
MQEGFFRGAPGKQPSARNRRTPHAMIKFLFSILKNTYHDGRLEQN